MSMPHRDLSSGCSATSESSSATARDGRISRQEPLEPRLLGLEPLLVEAGRLGEQSALVGEVGEGRPAPQGEGVLEREDGQVRVDRQLPSRLADEGVEAHGVKLVAIDAQSVAGRLTLASARRRGRAAGARRRCG